MPKKIYSRSSTSKRGKSNYSKHISNKKTRIVVKQKTILTKAKIKQVENKYPEYQMKILLWINYDDSPYVDEWHSVMNDNGEREFYGLAKIPNNFDFGYEKIEKIINNWEYARITEKVIPKEIRDISKEIHRKISKDGYITLYRGIDADGINKKGRSILEPLVVSSKQKYYLEEGFIPKKLAKEVYDGTRARIDTATSWTDDIKLAKNFAKPYVLETKIPYDSILISHKVSPMLDQSSQNEYIVKSNVELGDTKVIKI